MKLGVAALALLFVACGISASDMAKVTAADAVLRAAASQECGPASALETKAAVCAVHAVLVVHDAGAPLDGCPAVTP